MASIKFISDFVGTVGKQGVTFNGTTGDIPISRSFKHKRHNPFIRQVLIAILLGVACTMPVMAAEIQLPAIVEPASQEHHVGKLIFVELVTPDIAAAKKFYAGLFGWTFRDIQGGEIKYAAGISRRSFRGRIDSQEGSSQRTSTAGVAELLRRG